MALKDKPSPKYMFPGAGTSLLKSYKILQNPTKSLLLVRKLSFSRFLRAAATATAATLAAAAAPGSKTPWP